MKIFFVSLGCDKNLVDSEKYPASSPTPAKTTVSSGFFLSAIAIPTPMPAPVKFCSAFAPLQITVFKNVPKFPSSPATGDGKNPPMVAIIVPMINVANKP